MQPIKLAKLFYQKNNTENYQSVNYRDPEEVAASKTRLSRNFSRFNDTYLDTSIAMSPARTGSDPPIHRKSGLNIRRGRGIHPRP
jgi:hypothetical protein